MGNRVLIFIVILEIVNPSSVARKEAVSREERRISRRRSQRHAANEEFREERRIALVGKKRLAKRGKRPRSRQKRLAGRVEAPREERWARENGGATLRGEEVLDTRNHTFVIPVRSL